MQVHPTNQINNTNFKSLIVYPNKNICPDTATAIRKNAEIQSFAQSLHEAGFDTIVSTFEYEVLGLPKEGKRVGLAFSLTKRFNSLQSLTIKKNFLKITDSIENTLKRFNAQKTLELVKK